MSRKPDNILQFGVRTNSVGGKISVDSSDSENNEEESENLTKEKPILSSWGKPGALNPGIKKPPVISFEALEKDEIKQEERKEHINNEAPPPKPHFPSSTVAQDRPFKPNYYDHGDDDYFDQQTNSYYQNNGGHVIKSRSNNNIRRRNEFYDTDDNDGGYGYRPEPNQITPSLRIIPGGRQQPPPPPQTDSSNFNSSSDRNYDRNSDRNYDRNSDRNYDRNSDRNYDRNSDRNYDRNYDRNSNYRNKNYNFDRRPNYDNQPEIRLGVKKAQQPDPPSQQPYTTSRVPNSQSYSNVRTSHSFNPTTITFGKQQPADPTETTWTPPSKTDK